MSKDNEDNTALHLTCQGHGDQKTIDLVRNTGIDKKNKDNQTALHMTVLKGNIPNSLKLIKLQAQVDITAKYSFHETDYTMTPLQLAVATGNPQLVYILIGHNANKGVRNDKGQSLLHLAIEFDQIQIFMYLIDKHRLDPKDLQDNEGISCLSYAALLGRIAIVNRLLKIDKVPTNSCDMEGRTALHYAVLGRQLRIVLLLKQNDADFNAQDKHTKTPLQLLQKLSEGETNENKLYEEFYNEFSVIQKAPLGTEIAPIEIHNLVFQGGGVKGIAYIGAIKILCDHDQKFYDNIQRLAGTSAGAIISSLLAIGFSPDDLKDLLSKTNFSGFLDYYDPKVTLETLKDEAPKFMKELRQPSVLEFMKFLYNEYFKTSTSIAQKYKTLNMNQGLCKGDVFRNWLNDNIKEKLQRLYPKETKKNPNFGNNLTLGELKELIKSKPAIHKHLHVMIAQITGSSKPLELNVGSEEDKWDNIIIADLVRCSMSLPLIYGPAQLYIKNNDGKRVHYSHDKFIDGGIINNYAIELFDKVETGTLLDQKTITHTNEHTLGFSLFSNSSNEVNGDTDDTDVLKIVQQSLGFIINHETLVKDSKADNRRRTVYIDTVGVSTIDFNLSKENSEALVESGKKSALARIDTQNNKFVFEEIPYEVNEAFFGAGKKTPKKIMMEDLIGQDVNNPNNFGSAGDNDLHVKGKSSRKLQSIETGHQMTSSASQLNSPFGFITQGFRLLTPSSEQPTQQEILKPKRRFKSPLPHLTNN